MNVTGMDNIFETAAAIGHLAPYLDSLKRTESIKPYQTGSSKYMIQESSRITIYGRRKEKLDEPLETP